MREGLKHKTNPVAAQFGEPAIIQCPEVIAADQDLALVISIEPSRDVEQGRLARPGFANNGDKFPRRNAQREIPKQHAAARNAFSKRA